MIDGCSNNWRWQFMSMVFSICMICYAISCGPDNAEEYCGDIIVQLKNLGAHEMYLGENMQLVSADAPWILIDERWRVATRFHLERIEAASDSLLDLNAPSSLDDFDHQVKIFASAWKESVKYYAQAFDLYTTIDNVNPNLEAAAKAISFQQTANSQISAMESTFNVESCFE